MKTCVINSNLMNVIDGEYRCRNGMCIPEEYFLDGDFDCLDWSDEIQSYGDKNCPINAASVRCDDRFCPPMQYSCGDGQCVSKRFKFDYTLGMDDDCYSRREHYFFCETHSSKPMWTLPNGRCYEGSDYEEVNVTNGTQEERCEYILRCSLFRGIEKNCVCNQYFSCSFGLLNTCSNSSKFIQYPKRGILTPYILFFYYIRRSTPWLRPDFIWINGTFKCEGNLTSVDGVKYESLPTFNKMEEMVCNLPNKNSTILDDIYSQYSFTFNNRSYNSFDGCNKPRRSISTYRIADGFADCGNGADEFGNASTLSYCTEVQQHRFRCSTDENKYLSIIRLGDNKNNCENKYDEIWFGANVRLSNIRCNDNGKDQCTLLRQYIEDSWMLNATNQMAEQSRISFRYYCDTFWSLVQHEDENIEQCRQWWRCSEEQWQCDTGQCIDSKWVLDGEWDCEDASDEVAPFHRYFSSRNLEIISQSTLEERYRNLSKSLPLSTMCNETTEFHCLPANLSHHIIRPCINRDHISDGHIDCYGAIDERHTITHCTQPTMLGDNFRCLSSNRCIQYRHFCLSGRCTIESDEQFWCNRQSDALDCKDPMDTVCFNGTCVKGGRCNRKIDCLFGEDEYMCDYDNTLRVYDTPYRDEKQFFMKGVEQKLRLIRFPADSNFTKAIPNGNSTVQTNDTQLFVAYNTTTPIPYWCNRGVGVYNHNRSIVCFCPPQYYGEKCQYHNDRIAVLIHLNLSQSIFNRNSDINMVLKILVLFLFKNETLTNHVFHVRPSAESFTYTKKYVHFLYSRSSQYLQHKRERSRNQSNIIHDHPYSIRIELYERKRSGNPFFLAVWQYPIYFDYLPVFRFAKVLRFIEPKPCSSNPCHPNEDCHQLINDPSKHLCFCKSHFKGKDCSIEDSYCRNGFCANGAICKPNYRGILFGNEFPYCICPFDRFGDQCYLEHDLCTSRPCLNNGSCFPTSDPNTFTCKCTEEYYGNNCEKTKPVVKLYFNRTLPHAAVVIQYFHINFASLQLTLSHQQIYHSLLPLIEYRHQDRTSPELILSKVYSTSIDIPPEIYLLSAHVDAVNISATVQLNEENQCSHINTLTVPPETPIQYHFLCENNTDLLCFRDDFYLCICEENHTRVECFYYDFNFDQCSRCLAGGRCLQVDRRRTTDFLCLCPPCYSGKSCQFNSNSFVFTLDQLFLPDLHSTRQTRTICLLIIIPCFFAFFALLNNLFSFVTFRRLKCSTNGIGQCLLALSIINQLNFTILVARLIHLSLIITGLSVHPHLDNFLCKILNYLLTSLMRIVYWLVSFVGTERVYTVIFLKGQWLNKTSVARYLIVFIILIVGGSTAYELFFIRSFLFEDETMKNMCVIDFPSHSRNRWILVHKIVSITHSILPLLINLACTIIVIYVITRTKLNIRRTGEGRYCIDWAFSREI